MPSASLKYTDRTDRAFGLCGMALALYIYDAEQYLDTLSTDAPYDCGISLTPDFFTVNNPSLSVKSVWKSSLENFNILSAMSFANLLSRSLIRRRCDLSNEVRSLMTVSLAAEGAESCGLEVAEVHHICDSAYTYMHRVLSHPIVAQAIESMAKELDSRHKLSRDEILPFLAPLRGI